MTLQKIRAKRKAREEEERREREARVKRVQDFRISRAAQAAQAAQQPALPPFPIGQTPVPAPGAPQKEDDGFSLRGAIRAPFGKALDFLQASAETGAGTAFAIGSEIPGLGSLDPLENFRANLRENRAEGKGLVGSLREAERETEFPRYVKGATEILADPLNLVGGIVTGGASFAARAGLRGAKAVAAGRGAEGVSRLTSRGAGTIEDIFRGARGRHGAIGERGDVALRDGAERAIRAQEDPTTFDELFSGAGARLTNEGYAARRGEAVGSVTKKLPNAITGPVGFAINWGNPAPALLRAGPVQQISHWYTTMAREAPDMVASGISPLKALGKATDSQIGFDITEDGRVLFPGGVKRSVERLYESGLGDTEIRKFLTVSQVRHITEHKAYIQSMRELAQRHGIDLKQFTDEGEELYPRFVKEIRGQEVGPKSGPFKKPRVIADADVETFIAANRVKYLGDPTAQAEAFGDVIYKLIRDKKITDRLLPLAKSIPPENLAAIRLVAKNADKKVETITGILKKITVGRASLNTVPEEFTKKLKELLPHRADQIDELTKEIPPTLQGTLGLSQRKADIASLRSEIKDQLDLLERVQKEAVEKSAVINNLIRKGRAPLKGQAQRDAKVKLLGANAKEVTGNAVPRTLRDSTGKVPGSLLNTRWDPDEIKALEAAFDVDGSAAKTLLEFTGSVGDVFRIAKAGFDLGAPFIQGLPLLARSPKLWAESVGHMFKAFRDERFHWDFIARNQETVNEMVRFGVPLGERSTDFFDAIRRGGPLDSAFIQGSAARKKAADIAKGSMNRFNIAFQAPLDMGRIKQWQSLRDTVINGAKKKKISEAEALQGLGQYIRNSTGALDTTRLGVGRSRQALERSFMFFSPRYTRASIALVADFMQGGVAGQQSRKTLTNMMAGGAMVHSAFATALGQDPNFNPTKGPFMTLSINGDQVGPGTIFIQMARTAGKLGNALTGDDPGEVLSRSTRDGPIAQFVRGRAAPPGGVAWDIFSGADFLGEPLEGPVDWTKHIGQALLPFSVEAYLISDPNRQHLTGGVPSGFFGLRSYPQGVFIHRNNMREVMSERTFDKKWEELNKAQQDSLEREDSPEGEQLRKLTEQGQGQRVLRGEEIDREVSAFFNRRDEINAEWSVAIEGVVDTSINDMNSTKDFVAMREGFTVANSNRRAKFRSLEKSEMAQRPLEYLDSLERKLGGPELIEDVAYAQFLDKVIFNDDFVDPATGDVDFDARQVAERGFQQQWGDEIMSYVQTRLDEGVNLHPYQAELNAGREKFDFYWDETARAAIQQRPDSEAAQVEYLLWKNSGADEKKLREDASPALNSLIKQIARVRKRLRERDQQLDVFLHRWFGLNLVHPENQWEEASSHYKRMQPMVDVNYTIS